MEILTIIVIGIGLSFDSFAVSLSSGMIDKKIVFWNACKIAFFLALFQGAFPVIGWLIGSYIEKSAEQADHWIAFGLLAIVGGKMIWEQFQKEEEVKPKNPLKMSVLIGMSIATSIDAFVVGIGFGLLSLNILVAALIIGAITFIASMTGIFLGKKAAGKLGSYANLIGGVILIIIGTKILIEHLIEHGM